MSLPSRASRPLVASFLLVAATVPLVLVACGGQTVSVGRTDGDLKKKKDGGPTGNGQTCSWDDTVASDGSVTPAPNGPYRVGDTFPSPDGCNNCSCTAEGIACTEMACDPGPGTCTYEGKTYARGAKFPAVDGCNTCTCTEYGASCTEMACPNVCYGSDGKIYKDGDTWSDGCNTCGCTGQQINCTAMACP